MSEQLCWFCDEEIKSEDEFMFMVIGFEKLRAAGGANMIHRRERLGPRVHDRCVQAEKGKPPVMKETLRLDLGERYHATAKR